MLCSLVGRYDNPIPTRFLAPINCLKIPAQFNPHFLLFLSQRVSSSLPRKTFNILVLCVSADVSWRVGGGGVTVYLRMHCMFLDFNSIWLSVSVFKCKAENDGY